MTTKKYKLMVNLYKKYEDQGLQIIATPCNQFMGQEPDTNENIKKFASESFGVTFPMLAKSDVNGKNVSDLYKYLRQNSELYDSAKQSSSVIPWNFAVFVVKLDTNKIDYFAPQASDKEIEDLVA